MSLPLLAMVLAYLAAGGLLLYLTVRVFRFDPSAQMRRRLDRFGIEEDEVEAGPVDGIGRRSSARSGPGPWQRLSGNLDQMLARADMQGKAGLYVTATVFLAVLVASIAVARTGTTPAALPAALVGGMGPRIYVKVMTGRRQSALQGQLADALGMIAEAVRAGHTFLQGVKMVAREMRPPVSAEMQQILDSIQLGRTVEGALEEFARRNSSYDIGIAVTAIGVQREVGGNLTETLDRIAETVRERERVRGEVNALTAQGKLSGLVISLIPVALLLLMSMLNPEYMGALTGTGPGRVLLGGASIGWLIGFLMIGKITNVKY